MIKVVVDSTCDLPEEMYQQYGLTVVPINIQFGSETYRDRIDIDRQTFLRKIDESGMLPQTSQPSAGQFLECYRRLAEEGASDIISIHVTAKLSGTYQSAQIAGEMVADQVRVHPFDSAGGSVGVGFLALEASRMAERRMSVEEILGRLSTVRSRIQILLTVKDLRFAQLSGRVGKLQGSLAALLNIKPIIVLEDGVIDVAEKVRTRSKAIDRMLEMMVERIGTSAPVNLATIHSESADLGAELLERAKVIFNCQEAFLVNLTTALVVHFGPGTLGLVAYQV